MTVQLFILLYNETFRYISEVYGPNALRGLWGEISDRWCCHLDELVAAKGLEGMKEYWGGDAGTLAREKAEYEVALRDGVFTVAMQECPSVGEIVQRGRRPLSGEVSYCDHCPALYGPVAQRHGFEMTFEIAHDDDGSCAGRCLMSAREKPR